MVVQPKQMDWSMKHMSINGCDIEGETGADDLWQILGTELC